MSGLASRKRQSHDQMNIGIKEIEEKVRPIIEKYRPDKIILFGSYAAGNPTPASDVDLLVIMNTDRSTLELAAEVSLTVEHSFPMDILVRTPQEIAKRLQYGDFFIQDILEKGKLLYERPCQ
jgi:predicted nucleotidyltransferase